MKLQHAPRFVLALTLLTSGTWALAQSMKPGLWEITTQMQGGSGQMNDAMAKAQKALEGMSPEQRKMMQDMMAKQGVQMGGPAAGGGMAVKVCMTQEMVDRNEVGTQKGDCTHTNSPRSGNTMKFAFVCTQPPSSGEGQVTFSSPESYTVTMTSSTAVRGNAEKMTMQSNGRWLGSDCGGLKPLAPPKK